jgi:hypothetical protein
MSAQHRDLPPTPSTPFAPSQLRDSTLPLGVRRFHLDPLRHREYATAHVLRSVLVFAGALALVLLLAVAAGLSSAAAVTVFVVVTALAATPGLRFARRTDSPQLLTYELLVGTRVVRRTVAGSQPAEMLRPEVTAIYETSEGLWLTSTTPRDPSLGAELELVRGASSKYWEQYVTTPVLRRLRRVTFGLPYDGIPK